MSTSLLYHGFAIRGYRYRKTDYVNGDVAFTIEQERKALRCAACGSASNSRRPRKALQNREFPVSLS